MGVRGGDAADALDLLLATGCDDRCQGRGPIDSDDEDILLWLSRAKLPHNAKQLFKQRMYTRWFVLWQRVEDEAVSGIWIHDPDSSLVRKIPELLTLLTQKLCDVSISSQTWKQRPATRSSIYFIKATKLARASVFLRGISGILMWFYTHLRGILWSFSTLTHTHTHQKTNVDVQTYSGCFGPIFAIPHGNLFPAELFGCPRRANFQKGFF